MHYIHLTTAGPHVATVWGGDAPLGPEFTFVSGPYRHLLVARLCAAWLRAAWRLAN